MASLERTYRPMLEAVAYAARAHRHQVRKDGETPYASHVFRVCLVLRHVFGVDDEQALTAAVLHDTIEDTNTDYDDLAEHFGADVASWVAALSKDKRQPEDAREADYLAGLLRCPAWQVRVCKLADMFDNLIDMKHTKPAQRQRTTQRLRSYLQALGQDLPEQARRPYEMVAQLLREIEGAGA